ncbi:hypothetical protein SLEP1_g46724 [Rubroshorea leprosula]|uniref:Uncharacterized protein n=1 Tax=Rubroshorea leprosula TaxID=152421 RepID=A0AAV5LP00_9ROSI|nr:hypothetical protein SLEP1_g46724 [Rubroshorea leprosula]
MQKEIGNFQKKKEGTQLKKLKVGGPTPPTSSFPINLSSLLQPLLCAATLLQPDPAAAKIDPAPMWQSTEHEINLQDDITLQLSWLSCRASFGLTRSTVEGKRRKIEGFG